MGEGGKALGPSQGHRGSHDFDTATIRTCCWWCCFQVRCLRSMGTFGELSGQAASPTLPRNAPEPPREGWTGVG